MTGRTTPADRAATLLELHRPGDPVILPTVWDAWSARLATGAGFAALTVGSHPMADSIGKPDNEGMSFDDVLARVAQITAAVDVPVSVDIESGYGQPPGRLIEGELPSPIDLPRGCRFASRCPHRMPRCQEVEPALAPAAPGHAVACHLYSDAGQGGSA